MERPKVVRVAKDEFELSDGSVHPMMFDSEGSAVPTVEEFQQTYDLWFDLFRQLGLVRDDEQETGGNR